MEVHFRHRLIEARAPWLSSSYISTSEINSVETTMPPSDSESPQTAKTNPLTTIRGKKYSFCQQPICTLQ